MGTVEKRKKNRCAKCALSTCIFTSVVVFLVFALCFVIVPLVFKFSVGIQRSIIFPTWYIEPKNYSDIKSFGITGVKNFYVEVNDADNVTLGVWQILPSQVLNENTPNDMYNYDEMLSNRNYNVLLYLHGNGNDRTAAVELYQILRKNFHIIACDYRGYGDSSKAELTENAIANDVTYLYRWLRNRTEADIFVWGHSLGTGVSTHVISNLKEFNIVPTGLVLESPFTSVTDVMEAHPIIKFYSWLPWYRATLIDPMISNGFQFEPKKYVADVNCPIMILHAKDDDIIPYEFADKLYEVATTERDTKYQGNVTYHLWEADKGYGHMLIFYAPELPKYVSNFVEDCVKFQNRSKSKQ